MAPYTEDGNDVYPGATSCDENTTLLSNRLYRYGWNGTELVNMSLILDLPVGPVADHNDGVLTVGLDGSVYVLIGDGDRSRVQGVWCSGLFDFKGLRLIPILGKGQTVIYNCYHTSTETFTG